MSRFFTRYFTSVLVFMFALPIGTLLFGGFGSGRGFAAGAAVATVCAIFTYIFWPKLKDNSAPGRILRVRRRTHPNNAPLGVSPTLSGWVIRQMLRYSRGYKDGK